MEGPGRVLFGSCVVEIPFAPTEFPPTPLVWQEESNTQPGRTRLGFSETPGRIQRGSQSFAPQREKMELPTQLLCQSEAVLTSYKCAGISLLMPVSSLLRTSLELAGIPLLLSCAHLETQGIGTGSSFLCSLFSLLHHRGCSGGPSLAAS